MKKAFTLIELLVVVLIIGILAAIALPQYTKAVEKAKMAEAITNAGAIKRAVDMYLLEQGGFPSSHIDLFDVLKGSGIELSGGEWVHDNFAYTTKDFYYHGGCNTSNCEVIIDSNLEREWYSLVSLKTNTWSNYCVTQNTDFGRSICKNVSGYDYMDGEY